MSQQRRSLSEAMRWRSYDVGSGIGSSVRTVSVGTVGSGTPVGLLTAGVHGDEGPWSSLAIHELLSTTFEEDLVGSLKVVPVANPLAVEANAREASIDRLNLNVVFPGRSNGSYSERVAAVIAEAAIDGASVVLDLHGGGSWNINCFAYRIPGSEQLAGWLEAPLILDQVYNQATLAGFACSQNAKAVWVEMGGRGALEMERVSQLAVSVRHALGCAGVLTPTPSSGRQSFEGHGKAALFTAGGGIYEPVLGEAELGAKVAKGAVVGRLLDAATCSVLETFRAPFEQNIAALLRPTIALIEGAGKVVAMFADVS